MAAIGNGQRETIERLLEGHCFGACIKFFGCFLLAVCEPFPCENGGVCDPGTGSCDCTGTGSMGTTCQGNQVLLSSQQVCVRNQGVDRVAVPVLASWEPPVKVTRSYFPHRKCV